MTDDRTQQLIAEARSMHYSRRTILKRGGALGLSLPALGAVLSETGHAAPGISTYSSAFRQESIKLQVTVWLGEQEYDAMVQLGQRFTETHPNVQIEFINIVDGGPFGRDKVQQMIAGGTPPDVFMLNTGQFESFASRGALAPLDDRIAAENYDLGIYWPAAVEGCKVDGQVYGLPKDISDHIVYINADLFEASGVAIPENSWTWDDFRETAKALTKDTNGDGAPDQWGTSIPNGVAHWGSFVLSNGGEILSEDRQECHLTMPESVEALEFYYGLLTNDQASVPPGTLPQTPGEGDQFLSGVIGMNFAGPWFRPGLVENKPFNWTIRLFPTTPKGGAPISILYTDQWSMSATSDHPDESWELVKFLGGNEGLTIWSEIYGSRSITPVQELALSDKWMNYGGPEHRADNQTILDQLEATQSPPINFADGAEVDNVWNEQLSLVMIGQQSVDQAVQTICDTIDPILQQP